MSFRMPPNLKQLTSTFCARRSASFRDVVLTMDSRSSAMSISDLLFCVALPANPSFPFVTCSLIILLSPLYLYQSLYHSFASQARYARNQFGVSLPSQEGSETLIPSPRYQCWLPAFS